MYLILTAILAPLTVASAAACIGVVNERGTGVHRAEDSANDFKRWAGQTPPCRITRSLGWATTQTLRPIRDGFAKQFGPRVDA